MTIRALRKLAFALLKERGIPDSWISPCIRLAVWTVLERRWQSRGRDGLAWIAGRRVEWLQSRCDRLHEGGRCATAEAGEVVSEMLRRGAAA